MLIPLGPAITISPSGNSDIYKTFGSTINIFFGQQIISDNNVYQNNNILLLGIIIYISSILILLIQFILILFKFNKFKNYLYLISILLTLFISFAPLFLKESIIHILSYSLFGETNQTIEKTIFNNSTINYGVFGMSIFGFLSLFSQIIYLFINGTIDKLRAALLVLYEK